MLRHAHNRAARRVAMAVVWCCRRERWPSGSGRRRCTALTGGGFGGWYGRQLCRPAHGRSRNRRSDGHAEKQGGGRRAGRRRAPRLEGVLVCSVSPGTKSPMLAPGSPALCKSRAGQSEDTDIVTKDAESSWSVDSRVEAEKLVRRVRVAWMQAGQAWLSCPGQRREASQQGGSSRGSWILAQWRCEGGGLPGWMPRWPEFRPESICHGSIGKVQQPNPCPNNSVHLFFFSSASVQRDDRANGELQRR
jgi:hypothetical protein